MLSLTQKVMTAIELQAGLHLDLARHATQHQRKCAVSTMGSRQANIAQLLIPSTALQDGSDAESAGRARQCEHACAVAAQGSRQAFATQR